MASELLCSNGHLWDISVDETTIDGLSFMACPICGERCTPASPPVAGRMETDEDRPDAKDRADSGCPNDDNVLPRVPGYEIQGVLGEGGMGKVFKARHLRLDRIVALKMISADRTSFVHRSRFQVEGQALAKLDDPHIVQIYEVNECNGVPYFSLEYLDGGSLQQKLAGLPQPPLEAARLVETLARAIHSAHQRGIVHRDLKPANILLNREGVPKITDFGLAKRFAEDRNQTRTGDLVGTPAYMAPEQTICDQAAIGPITDVYALGVMLYEMLTGRPPFRGVNSLETLQMIRRSEPVSPRRLQPGVSRDLETICLKCMEKSPAKRYASAQQLGEDLLRFQSHQTILARRAGIRERVQKWMRRNPAASALIGVIVLATVSLVLLGVWSNSRLRLSAARADNRSRVARSVVDDLYTQFAEEWLSEEPYKDPIRQEFLLKALHLYQEFAKEEMADATLQRETAMAHFRLGQIQRILNDNQAAQDAYFEAIKIQQRLCKEFPVERVHRQDLANSFNWLGELLRQTDAMQEAEQNYQQALAIQNELVVQSPGNPVYRQELARSHYNLAILLIDTSRPDAASEHLATADTLLNQLHAEFPEVVAYRHEWARCFINRGVLQHERQAFDDAEQDYRRAIELLRHLTPLEPTQIETSTSRGPTRVVYRSDLAAAHRNLGNLLWTQGKIEPALDETIRALDLLRRLVAEYPLRPAYQKTLADTYNSAGSVLASNGRWDEAARNYTLARDLFLRLVNDYADVLEYQQLLGITVGNLGWVQTELQDWKGAKILLQEAILHLQSAHAANPRNFLSIRALGNQYQSLAEVAIRLGDHATAVDAADALASIGRDQGQDCYYAACFLARCLPLVKADSTIRDERLRDAREQDYTRQATAMLQQAIDSRSVRRLADEHAIFRPLFTHRPEWEQRLNAWE